MAVDDKLTKEFLQVLKQVEEILFSMQFRQSSFLKEGIAYFIQYKRSDYTVEFLFGPPEYQIEMIIYTSKEKFSFKDLLQIPSIAAWVNNNRYIQKNGRDVKSEMLWFIELLKIYLTLQIYQSSVGDSSDIPVS